MSECAVSAARLNAIADRTAANYPSLAAELRRIASGIRPAETEVDAEAEADAEVRAPSEDESRAQ